MSDRIGDFSGFQPGFSPGMDRDGQQQQAGQFRGDSVTLKYTETSFLKDAQAALQDAAEEMTFGASERSKTRLEDRKLERADTHKRVELIQAIQEHMEKLPDLDMRRLGRLLATIQEMRARGDQPSREELQDLLEGFHEDISYQHVALEQIVSQLVGEAPDAPITQAASALLAENERRFGAEIRAGLNVTGAALALAADAGEVQELRNFYRASVLDHASVRQSYANIVERYGDGDIGERISFLLKAIGEDLQAKGPSVAPAELKAILDDVHQLESLSTIRERVIESLERLDARFGLY